MTQVFSKDWFLRHQKTLLWLANHWLTKRWFRWVLRIRRCDCPIDTKINQILPNSFTYNVKLKGDKLEATTDFRVNDKFARRLYYAFKPVWWLFHVWDWGTMKRPTWNMGFDTLTQYPGSVASGNPCDGTAIRDGTIDETFATIVGGAGVSVDKTNIMVGHRSSSTTNQFQMLFRGVFCFDTASLTGAAVISAATLSLYGSGKTTDLGAFTVHVVTSAPTDTDDLVAADYAKAKYGTTVFGSVASGDYDTAGYNAMPLNASGLSAISLTSITKLGARTAWDIDESFGGTWGSVKISRIVAKVADTAGTTEDPKLVITYTLASTTPAFALLLGCG